MTPREQDIQLLLKLYLLDRHNSYINYMEGFKLLKQWLIDEEDDNDTDEYITNPESFNNTTRNTTQRPTRTYQDIPCILLCSTCFRVLDRIPGGGITLSCTSCTVSSNLPHEIQRICIELDIQLDYCIYLICSVVEDIYRDVNNVKVQLQIAYPRGQIRQ